MQTKTLATFILVCVALLVNCVECVRILGVFPAPGYSQFILGEKLMLELAKRGHQVTVISPYRPAQEPNNYRTISTRETLEGDQGDDLFVLEKLGVIRNVIITYDYGLHITEDTLKHEKVQNFLKSTNETFDLVIVESFLNEALYAFAKHFNAPLVLFSSITQTVWQNFLMGNPSLPSITPVGFNDFTRHMNLYQRALNTIHTIFDFAYKRLVVLPKHSELLNKYFPDSNGNLNLDEIIYNSSLMLINSHVTTSENAAFVHGIVEIGGFHIDPQPLSPELQKYLDEAEDGAIFFSLGTNLKPSQLSKRKIQTILNVFGKLKQKILWKFDKDLEERPDNVLISKWFNQVDIFAHLNIRLFITHGGLLSATEALFHGVPSVGIPVFGDQKLNMERARRNGYAEIIALEDLEDEEIFSNCIRQVLENPRYQENARKFSNVLRDGIAKPLDLAMYWIEYVLRHRGFHLKPPSLQLYWFEYYMLDLAALVVLKLVILYISVKCLISISRRNISASSRKCNIKQNNNAKQQKTKNKPKLSNKKSK